MGLQTTFDVKSDSPRLLPRFGNGSQIPGYATRNPDCVRGAYFLPIYSFRLVMSLIVSRPSLRCRSC